MNNNIYDDFHIRRTGYDYQIIVNGVDIGAVYSIDDEELLKALTQSGYFYPFTCGCGVPECAGIFEPICCTKNGDKMLWIKKEPAPYQTISFNIKNVLVEFEAVLSGIFDELFEKYGDSPWEVSDFPHGPFGTTLLTVRQTRDSCRKYLHIEETIDHQAKQLSLTSILENNCSPAELIQALKIGNIHETIGMQNEEPIHAAAWHNSHTENIDLLLVRGANINAIDEYNETPLFYAVKGKYPEIMIPHLFYCGADIEARNDYGQTPFLAALDYLDDPIQVITILQNHRCNVLAVDEYGNGAFEYAAMRNHSAEVIKLLTFFGCQRKD
ncbi:MAG: ankyrin repeat domain-containing protein [Lentisphaeria bacterium]|nr:ankyrin repeat domain-containing protein [Lentisphaeria bacterium]